MTAVEWLIDEWLHLDSEFDMQLIDRNLYWDYLKTKWIKAKEMEEKQRQEDTNHGYSEGYDDGINGEEPMKPVLKSE